MALFSRARAKAAGATQISVAAPVAGRIVPLAEVGDRVFAQGLMGQGVGIVPSRGEVRAPITGRVTTAFPTGHAYGIQSADGVDVLVHIGLDTVDLDGLGFSREVDQGQAVAAGDLLATVDVAAVRAAGKDPTTIVVVTNTRKLAAVVPADGGDVETGDSIITVRTDPEAHTR